MTSDMPCTGCNSARLLPTGSPSKRWDLASTNCAKGMQERGIGYCTYDATHCFEKRSNAIEQKDIETAKTRLKRVLEAEREEKRNAKQALRRK